MGVFWRASARCLCVKCLAAIMYFLKGGKGEGEK